MANRFRAAGLWFLLLCLLLGGCQPHGATQAQSPSAGESNPEGYPIVKDKLTLNAFQFELDSQAIDFANLWFFKQLEDKTHIHVNFEEVKEADWITRLNLMFASGDLSDVLLRGYLDVEEFGVAQGLLVPLDDYLEQYMPVYTQRLRASGLPENRASDGHIYTVGFLIAQDINVNGHWFINREWLDALGLEIPTTLDELTHVLRAFKAGDPNGNGIADDIPYQATFNDTNTGLYNAFAFFGVPLNYESYLFIQPDQRVQLAAYAPGFRDCLTWLHTLYSEGLLDPECITQNTNVWSAKLNRDAGGLITYWRLTNSALKPEVARQFVCMLPVAAPGYQPKVSAILERMEMGAALTIANQHIPETLRWLDAQMETETMMIAQNGPLGDMLTLNEAGKYRVSNLPPDNELYKIVPVICGQFFAPSDYYQSVYEMAPHRAEKVGYCQYYQDAGVVEYKSFHYLTDIAPMAAEPNTRASLLYTEIDKFMTESLARFITGGVTDSQWQAFLDDLDQIGAAEYMALYQQAYDSYRQSQIEGDP